ncbi:nucleotidyltransferase family protein, partial [bacterium]|nr:nucleotidyltransferase family protein [candidate division CSSED10-310 bacterium]
FDMTINQSNDSTLLKKSHRHSPPESTEEYDPTRTLIQLMRSCILHPKLETLRMPLGKRDIITVFNSARIHGLTSCLYVMLCTYDSFEPDVQIYIKNLQSHYRFNAVRILRFQHETNHILQRFNRFNIPCLLLKGIYLSTFVYPDPAMRSMADIDLLIHQDDLVSAVTELMKIGYRDITDTVHQLHTHFHQTFYNESQDIYLELHWLLERPDRFETDMHRLWAEAQAIEFEGEPALCLSVEDLLLYLVIHNTITHSFHYGLRPLLDIALVMKKLQPDWKKLLELARQSNATEILLLTTQTVCDLFQLPVPDQIAFNLQDTQQTSSLRQAALRMACKGPEFSPALLSFIHKLQNAPNTRKKIKLLFRIVSSKSMMSRQSSAEKETFRHRVKPGHRISRLLKTYWRFFMKFCVNRNYRTTCLASANDYGLLNSRFHKHSNGSDTGSES